MKTAEMEGTNEDISSQKTVDSSQETIETSSQIVTNGIIQIGNIKTIRNSCSDLQEKPSDSKQIEEDLDTSAELNGSFENGICAATDDDALSIDEANMGYMPAESMTLIITDEDEDLEREKGRGNSHLHLLFALLFILKCAQFLGIKVLFDFQYYFCCFVFSTSFYFTET